MESRVFSVEEKREITGGGNDPSAWQKKGSSKKMEIGGGQKAARSVVLSEEGLPAMIRMITGKSVDLPQGDAVGNSSNGGRGN